MPNRAISAGLEHMTSATSRCRFGNRHIGVALGDSVASRRIRSRIARYSRHGTATSAIWKVTYLACRTTLAPILINFSPKVVIVQVFMGRGRTSLRKKLPKLYARANNCNRTWLSTKSWHESFVYFTALFPSRIHCSAVHL